MFKLIFIFIIAYYLIKKVGGFFFQTMVSGQQQQQQNSQQRTYSNQTNQRPEGTIRVDNNPNQGTKNPSDFKGGDYVDFEEVE